MYYVKPCNYGQIAESRNKRRELCVAFQEPKKQLFESVINFRNIDKMIYYSERLLLLVIANFSQKNCYDSVQS